MIRDPHAWARLGQALAAIRKAQGLRQEDLATQAGVSLGSVQNAESGQPPKARMPQSLYPIVKALDLPDGWIDATLRGEGPPGWHSVNVQGDVNEERIKADLNNVILRVADGATGAEIKAATKAALDVLRQHGLI